MPVVHFPCSNVSALEEANMRDPPLCYERFDARAALTRLRCARLIYRAVRRVRRKDSLRKLYTE